MKLSCELRLGRKTDTLRSALALLVLSLLFGSCAPSVQVVTASDPSVSFSDYKSFAMIAPNRPLHTDNTQVDPFVLQRLRQLVYLELKQKGLHPTDKATADVVVGVVAAQDEQVHIYSSGPYAYGSLYGPSRSHYIQTTDLRIVVIDIIDRKKKSVIWRGTGERAMDAGLGDAELQEIVESLLSESPIGTPQAPKP